MQLPDVREQITRQGIEVSVEGPREFAARIREETAQWAKVIESAGVRARWRCISCLARLRE